jgi:hypothetical protein
MWRAIVGFDGRVLAKTAYAGKYEWECEWWAISIMSCDNRKLACDKDLTHDFAYIWRAEGNGLRLEELSFR